MDECQICRIGDWYIQVGDVVQFKTLEELFDEFGRYDEDNLIKEEDSGLHAGFRKDMEHLCGQVFTIRSISVKEDYVVFRSVENIEAAPQRFSGHWIISDSMIKPYEESSDAGVSEDDFLSVLLGE